MLLFVDIMHSIETIGKLKIYNAIVWPVWAYDALKKTVICKSEKKHAQIIVHYSGNL